MPARSRRHLHGAGGERHWTTCWHTATSTFVSNADNLGAVLDVAILGFAAGQRILFLMEVADRTAADRRAATWRSSDGRLILRELRPAPARRGGGLQDIHLYRYFNSQQPVDQPSCWREILRTQRASRLPLIRNEKPVDPAKPSTPRLFNWKRPWARRLP